MVIISFSMAAYLVICPHACIVHLQQTLFTNLFPLSDQAEIKLNEQRK